MYPAFTSSALNRLLLPQKGPLQYSTIGMDLSRPTTHPISATSDRYSDLGTPGLADFRAPGMWLTAYS